MELRTTEGGHGSVILFNESQVWVTDRLVAYFLCYFGIFLNYIPLSVERKIQMDCQACLLTSVKIGI